MEKIKFGFGISILIALTLLVAACDQIQPPQKYTLKGTSTKTPFQIKSTFTATSEPPPTLTPSHTPTDTPTPTNTEEITETPSTTPSETATLEVATATTSPVIKTSKPPTSTKNSPGKPTIKVLITTNCRLGPGVHYPKLTPLLAGRVVPLIGRDKYFTYWVIKDPGGTGRDCWLWGNYAITTGDVNSLPVYDTPEQETDTPRPTVPTKTPTNTRTPGPSSTPNLTPATFTNTPLPPTATRTPSNTPIPSNTPPPSRTPTPSNTPRPSNTPPPNQCDSGSYYTVSSPYEEQLILNMINQARSDNHSNSNTSSSPPLSTSSSLVNIARAHGRDMLCNGTGSHTSTDGTRAWERIGIAMYGRSNWCYSNCCCGEIWHSGWSPQNNFDWWMTHPEDPPFCPLGNAHKCTILGQWYTRLGVGVTHLVDANGNVVRKFFTVDFVRY